MYAIVEIAGQQFKVEKNQQIFVHRLEEKEGSKVDFEDILLIDDGKKVNLGFPFIKGSKVKAKVIEHLKDDKVIVFKKKRRKGYRVKNGHRQYLTKIEILNIDEKVADKKSPAKKISTKAKAKPKAVAKKAPAKKKKIIKKAAAKKSE